MKSFSLSFLTFDTLQEGCESLATNVKSPVLPEEIHISPPTILSDW